MNEKLLKVLVGKCKDMGLSTESIQQIAGVASNGLGDDATEEAIEQRANEYMPVLQTMQSEATRWAQKQKQPKPTNPQLTKTIEKPQEESIDAIVEAVTAKLQAAMDEQKATITELQAQLTKNERSSLIASVTKKLGLSDVDMEFVAIPEDANVEEYLGRYKQSLVDRGLKPAEKNATPEAREKAESELAATLLAEFEAK